jgi:hypothetical protein
MGLIRSEQREVRAGQSRRAAAEDSDGRRRWRSARDQPPAVVLFPAALLSLRAREEMNGTEAFPLLTRL